MRHLCRYPSLKTWLVLLLLAWPPAAAAEVAHLVRDFPAAPDRFADSSVPNQFVRLGDRLVFVASQSEELWITDGTDHGTQLLADFCPSICLAEAEFIGQAGGLLYWLASPFEGQEGWIWRTDGTRPGTFPVTVGQVFLERFSTRRPITAVFDDALYFQGRTEQAGWELWRTDGTVAGTRMVRDILPGTEGAFPRNLVPFAGQLYFFAVNAESRPELWRTDGTTEGTHLVATFPDSAAEATDRLTVAGGHLFFRQDNELGQRRLWSINATAASPRRLAEFEPIDFVGAGLHFLKPLGNQVYFIAQDAEHGQQLWSSDGTPEGTAPRTDFRGDFPLGISPGSDALEFAGDRAVFVTALSLGTSYELYSNAGTPQSTTRLPTEVFRTAPRLYRVGDHVFFLDEEDGLWVTDGTPVGTRQITSATSLVTYIDGELFFIDQPESPGRALRRTDRATGQLRTITPLPRTDPEFGSRGVLEIARLGRSWIFAAAGLDRGQELWRTDGTPASTRMVTDIARGAPSSWPFLRTALGEKLLFGFHDGFPNVWISNGDPDDATLLFEFQGSEGDFIVPETAPGAAEPLAYFRSSQDFQLWRTGTSPGSLVQLTDFDGRFVGEPESMGSLLYFPVLGSGPAALWRSDGTVEGTELAVPFSQSQASSLGSLTAVGSDLYFFTGGSGRPRVWRSDGTPEGTHSLLEVDPGSSRPEFTRAGAYVYFVAQERSAGLSLWRTDGTSAGTSPVTTLESQSAYELTAFGEELFYYLHGRNTTGLWKVDASGAVVHVVPIPATLFFPENLFRDAHLTASEDALYFVANDGLHGREIWRSDGTSSGSRMVRDLWPGLSSSLPTSLTVADGQLYFVASDGLSGSELWRTDGSEEGTVLVQDIAPGGPGSDPRNLTATPSHLFFSADDGVVGRELWALPLAGGTCRPSATTLCLAGGRFRVEAWWWDIAGERQGLGQAVPLTPDTGTFWFFEPSNVEVILKVLDGTAINQHFWAFYGALSNVEYILIVTDTETGATRRYYNPSGLFASLGDTRAFGPLTPKDSLLVAGRDFAAAAVPEVHSRPSGVTSRPDKAGTPCQSSPQQLCLGDGRFAVEATWEDFDGNTGAGTAVGLTGDTGYFWFFQSSNVEVVLKVLDGTAINGRHWVFYGALSNVAYTLTVTDTNTGAVRTYTNRSGQFASVGDTQAF